MVSLSFAAINYNSQSLVKETLMQYGDTLLPLKLTWIDSKSSLIKKISFIQGPSVRLHTGIYLLSVLLNIYRNQIRGDSADF